MSLHPERDLCGLRRAQGSMLYAEMQKSGTRIPCELGSCAVGEVGVSEGGSFIEQDTSQTPPRDVLACGQCVVYHAEAGLPGPEPRLAAAEVAPRVSASGGIDTIAPL